MTTPAPSRACVAIAFLAIATAVLMPATAAAQACQQTGGPSVTMTVSDPSIDFPSPDVTAFNAGSIDHPSTVAVTVRPNSNGRSWELCIRANAPNLGGSKVLGDLRWSPDGASWAAMTTGYQIVATGRGEQTVSISFRMLLNWATDSPGTYGAPLEFRVANS